MIATVPKSAVAEIIDVVGHRAFDKALKEVRGGDLLVDCAYDPDTICTVLSSLSPAKQAEAYLYASDLPHHTPNHMDIENGILLVNSLATFAAHLGERDRWVCERFAAQANDDMCHAARALLASSCSVVNSQQDDLVEHHSSTRRPQSRSPRRKKQQGGSGVATTNAAASWPLLNQLIKSAGSWQASTGDAATTASSSSSSSQSINLYRFLAKALELPIAEFNTFRRMYLWPSLLSSDVIDQENLVSPPVLDTFDAHSGASVRKGYALHSLFRFRLVPTKMRERFRQKHMQTSQATLLCLILPGLPLEICTHIADFVLPDDAHIIVVKK